jgi:hypothetical protein
MWPRAYINQRIKYIEKHGRQDQLISEIFIRTYTYAESWGWSETYLISENGCIGARTEVCYFHLCYRTYSEIIFKWVNKSGRNITSYELKA